MRKWLILVLLLAALAGGLWFFLPWERLQRQYATHRVGAAATFEEAQREIAPFDTEPDRERKLHELVAGYGTGNETFDAYLAQHLASPGCSDTLREMFSLEFASRPDALSVWASLWAASTAREPDEEVSAMQSYLAALAMADPPRRISWREVLELQALFTLTGQPELAQRLKPDNWLGRYQRWIAARDEWPKTIKRP